MKSIDDLEIYKKSLSFVTEIYLLIKKHKMLERDFSLCDQIKRAAVSVSANISEGYFRSIKQTRNYLEIASGSTNEVVTLLIIAQNVHRIDASQLQLQYRILGRQINAFSNSLSHKSG
jgi:four helix bundle protein